MSSQRCSNPSDSVWTSGSASRARLTARQKNAPSEWRWIERGTRLKWTDQCFRGSVGEDDAALVRLSHDDAFRRVVEDGLEAHPLGLGHLVERAHFVCEAGGTGALRLQTAEQGQRLAEADHDQCGGKQTEDAKVARHSDYPEQRQPLEQRYQDGGKHCGGTDRTLTIACSLNVASSLR
jgi:hypothetical protein